MMRSAAAPFALLLLLALPWHPVRGQEFDEGAVETLVEDLARHFVDEREMPWRLSFEPDGLLWVHQFFGEDRFVHWDYGAEVQVEIARGRGHRIWWGGIYREAAGYNPTQTITPFDPRQIDVSQHLGWRYRIARRGVIFAELTRWCYHEVDVRNPSAVFFTNSGIGGGTVDPAEVHNVGARVRREGRMMVDGYLMAGPVISGGPVDILGNTVSRQAVAEARLLVTRPLGGTFLLQGDALLEGMLRHESADRRFVASVDLRVTLLIQAERGAVAFYLGRRVHDSFIVRHEPVDWYAGGEFRF